MIPSTLRVVPWRDRTLKELVRVFLSSYERFRCHPANLSPAAGRTQGSRSVRQSDAELLAAIENFRPGAEDV